MNIRAENRAQSMLAPWRPSMSRVAVLGLPWWAISLLFLAGYAFLDWASYVSPYRSFNITAWNPGAGLSFALVLLYGQRFLPLVALAPLIGSIAVLGTRVDWPVEIALSLTTGAAYAVGLSFLISPRTRFDASLSTMRDLLLLIATALVSSAIVAVGCISVLYVADQVPASDLVVVLRRFWVGDAIGIMVVAPLLLVFVTGGQFPGFGAETAAMSAAMIAAVVVVFAPSAISHLHLFYVLFLPIIWVALRYGLEGATLGLAFTQVALIVGVLWVKDAGPQVTALQMLMMVLSLTGLSIGSVVSERRRIEHQLRLNQEAVARILLIGSMGELASGIAHEVNQPLTAILNYNRVIKRHLESGSVDRTTALDAMRKSIAQVERTSALIKSMRELIRLGQSEIGPASPQKIVRESLDLLEHAIQRADVSVDVDMARDLPPVMADVLQIEQAFMNLVLNSIEAFEQRGDGERRISISVRQLGSEFVEFRVADTGPGFPESLAIDKGGPLTTTKAQGLGLGLALTRSIIEAHDGTLTLERGARGAVARFSVPTAAESDYAHE